MKVVGLISSYNEGTLLEGAVGSIVHACDRVGVFEGPIGDNPFGPRYTGHTTEQKVFYAHTRRYADPAEKRNACLDWARSVGADWIVWIDADEVMLWALYLRDMIARAEQEQQATGTAVGGFPIRVVELDGSVALSNNRVVNVTYVKRYLHDAYQVELTNGMVAALPNEKVCGAGGIPWGTVPMVQGSDGVLSMAHPESDEMQAYLGRHRPPVCGEPHVLHRAVLRDPARQARRLSEVEAEWFDKVPGQ